MPDISLTPFEEVSQAEKENIEKSKAFHGDQIRNYIQCYELLYSLNEHIGHQSTAKRIIFNHRDSVVLMISTRIVLSSKACLDLAMKGYYYDSEIIHRSLLENMCVLHLLVCCKDTEKANENAKKWLNGELKLHNVKKELKLLSNKEFSRGYRILSGFVHSDFKAVKTLIKFDFTQGSINVSPKPIFMPEAARIMLYPHAEFTVLYHLIANFAEVIEPDFKSKTLDTLNKLHEEGERLKNQSN
jgi:hypothetical protein